MPIIIKEILIKTTVESHLQKRVDEDLITEKLLPRIMDRLKIELERELKIREER